VKPFSLRTIHMYWRIAAALVIFAHSVKLSLEVSQAIRRHGHLGGCRAKAG